MLFAIWSVTYGHAFRPLHNTLGLLKHRVLLSLLFSASLRVREASQLKIFDIDSGRMMV